MNPDGTGELLEEIPNAYPNGIVAEPDGSIVWVESYDRGDYRRKPDSASQLIHVMPENHVPDGFKIAANGSLWITAFMGGGIDIVAPDGTAIDFLETGGVFLNCIFVDDSLVITDSGDVTDQALMGGRLWRVPVGVEGMPLFRGKVG